MNRTNKYGDSIKKKEYLIQLPQLLLPSYVISYNFGAYTYILSSLHLPHTKKDNISKWGTAYSSAHIFKSLHMH